MAIKSSASKIIPKNSIAIIVRVGVGKLAFLPFNYSTSQDFLSITEINVDELFALYSIYKKLKKDLSLVQGTSIKGITKEELLRKTLFIPIKKSEQARIGAFFRHLDRLITLHQCNCNMATRPYEWSFGLRAIAWEQRKLGELLAESKIKGHSGNVAKKLTIKLWGKGVVEKKDFGGSVYTQYYIRKYEQFIYSKLDFLNSAFAVIPKNMDGYESTSDLPAFDCVNSNPYFIFYRVTQKDFYLKNGSIADGSRKAKRIHVDTFLGMGINAPKILEQDKIVEFFQVLDRLITLHQRKHILLT